jgi:hypothetical protein
VIAITLINILLFTFKWLYHNRNSILIVLFNSVYLTFYLIIAYFLFIGSTSVFLKGIEIEPRSIPHFPHEMAVKVSDGLY